MTSEGNSLQIRPSNEHTAELTVTQIDDRLEISPPDIQSIGPVGSKPSAETMTPASKQMTEGVLVYLKERLGEKFTAHFQEEKGVMQCNVPRLFRLATAAVANDGMEPAFAKYFSATAKEACLTGLICDPALYHLKRAYNRCVIGGLFSRNTQDPIAEVVRAATLLLNMRTI